MALALVNALHRSLMLLSVSCEVEMAVHVRDDMAENSCTFGRSTLRCFV
ncbi:hypothetical protein RE6C_05629 [Rhodopirellula europaea 6C]|uniref:Uncharacterized protein n=1 Tax=Rhodopirellula europaea 6C TaxID=1263867 RepID=M2A3H2_9BACT|nr:hypothetical protein RE6C_05629 [Rhodopirellula europaea 6C]